VDPRWQQEKGKGQARRALGRSWAAGKLGRARGQGKRREVGAGLGGWGGPSARIERGAGFPFFLFVFFYFKAISKTSLKIILKISLNPHNTMKIMPQYECTTVAKFYDKFYFNEDYYFHCFMSTKIQN